MRTELLRSFAILVLVFAVLWLLTTIATSRPAAQQESFPPGHPASLDVGSEQRTGAPPTGAKPSGLIPDSGEVTVVTGGAPKPSGGIGEPLSYCKPQFCETAQPRIVDGISGQATWWNTFGGGFYVALRPDLGSKGDLVIVCGGEPFHCVTAPVITSCACLGPNSDRLVDLSRDLFAEFADPSLGVVRITLQVVGR